MGPHPLSVPRTPIQILFVPEKSIFTSLTPPLLDHHRSGPKNESDQNKTFRDVLGGLWVLGRMFGHEFHALLIFQKFLILELQMILLLFLIIFTHRRQLI